ncbi:MAG TPA: tetratricopeptide repeat protein [Planctomycetota bacterium]|nr:tetratricopeptide repeat protein [Planctomycetota bacterium]
MQAQRTLSPVAVVGLFAALALVAWWPVASCGFVWDDDDYVTQNPVLRTWAGLWQIWTEPRSLPQYYPLVHTSFWLEYRLWGLSPLGYHVDNVLLHTLAAWLVFRLCRQLALPLALLPAMWFLVHPVHVESVAWVTERKNVLSLVCALLAARSWLRWHDGGTRRDLGLGSAWFLGALLAKTVTASLPAALLVVLWWRDGRITRRALLGALPWLCAGAVLGGLTVFLEAEHVRAADPRFALHGAERLLVAGRALWFYLGCLAWPVGLCFQYPRWTLDVGDVVQWAWPAAALGVLAAAFLLRARLGRGPLAVLLLFGGTLVPALGFFDVFPFRYSFVADHFQYHASVPVLVGASACASPWLAQRLPRAVSRALLALFLAANVGLCWHAIGSYRDLDALWTDTLARNDRSTLALINLGGAANLRGDHKTAKELSERALAIDPTSHEAWNNLGTVAHVGGDRKTARACYEKALAHKPDDTAARHNLALLHLEEKRPRDALALLEAAVVTDPDYFEARITLVWALHDCGLWERALAAAHHVLQRLPDHVATRERAVSCFVQLQRWKEAASNAMAWLRAAPSSAAARQQLAATMAQALLAEPPANVRLVAESACRKGGVDAGAILPLVEEALRRLGAFGHADALRSGR